ncbi:8723_t:CDS:2, partial [Acaulospora morrowiae]
MDNVHVRLFLRDIHKYSSKSEGFFMFGRTSLRFLKVRVHGVIVEKDLAQQRIVIDDSTGTININLKPVLLKRFDIARLTVGTLVAVIGELRDEDKRWVDCEGYDTYYEPHSELMFALETMKFYKNHYFKEYYQGEVVKLPTRSMTIPDFSQGQEWVPYYATNIVRPEVMLQRNDLCNQQILMQDDVENQKDYRGKYNKKEEILKAHDINDNNKLVSMEFDNEHKNVKVIRNRILKEKLINNDEKGTSMRDVNK